MEKKQILVNEIKQIINDGIQEISLIYDNGYWSDPQFYANWLAQTFYYTRQATRVISWAAAKTPHHHEWIHLKLLQHTEEEKSHEELARHDIKKLGFSVDQFSELPSTTAYFATLFYLIEHSNPLTLFGYFSILEGLAVSAGTKLYNFIQQHYGKDAGSFLFVHCHADVKHFEDDLSILEKFNEVELEAVKKSAQLSIKLYQTLMYELIAIHQSILKVDEAKSPIHSIEHKYNQGANP